MPLKLVLTRTIDPAVKRSTVGVKTCEKSLAVLRVLMRAAGCPVNVTDGYLVYIQRRLHHEGHGFLARNRSLPILGMKILGRDTIEPLSGLKTSKHGYPRFLSWFYSRLSLYSRGVPSRNRAKQVRRILTVLSWANMFTIPVREDKVLKKYCDNVTRKLSYKGKVYPECTRSSLVNLLGGFNTDELDSLPSSRDFDNLSFRPSSLVSLEKRMQSPSGFSLELCTASAGLGPDSTKPHVVSNMGTITVLNEPAGKVRMICAYSDPFVHSNGLYTRARYVLDRIHQDVSSLQNRAMGYVVSASRDKRTYISGDLSSFTDNIKELYIDKVLTLLGLEKLKVELFSIPVRANGVKTEGNQGVKPEKRIVPTVLLMGLKGCFEVGSLAHHIALREAGIKDYVLCCDDILTPESSVKYNVALKRLGPELNRAKTIRSSTVATFCGMSYWGGHSIKPVKIRLTKFIGRRVSRTAKYDFLRSLTCNLLEVYKTKKVRNIINILMAELAYGSFVKGDRSTIFVKSLPIKLGGFGLPGSKSLLRLLETEDGLWCANKSVGIEKPKAEFNRWFKLPIDIMPSKAVKVLPWTPVLLRDGATLEMREVVERSRLYTSKIKIEDILEWFYFGKRVPIQGNLLMSDLYEDISTA